MCLLQAGVRVRSLGAWRAKVAAAGYLSIDHCLNCPPCFFLLYQRRSILKRNNAAGGAQETT